MGGGAVGSKIGCGNSGPEAGAGAGAGLAPAGQTGSRQGQGTAGHGRAGQGRAAHSFKQRTTMASVLLSSGAVLIAE